jgi:hypothetical protein
MQANARPCQLTSISLRRRRTRFDFHSVHFYRHLLEFVKMKKYISLMWPRSTLCSRALLWADLLLMLRPHRPHSDRKNQEKS